MTRMSAAEPEPEIQYRDRDYLHDLSLLPRHRAIFWAQLSGCADVSDAHLKYLVGAKDGNRRESSFLTATSSVLRPPVTSTNPKAVKAEDCEVKSFDLWQWIVSQCLPRCQASLIMMPLYGPPAARPGGQVIGLRSEDP